ncbi:MAG: hypothetical protein AVDCRST_MAG76-936, partial [uncultured Acidimicrobiales bacterium]
VDPDDGVRGPGRGHAAPRHRRPPGRHHRAVATPARGRRGLRRAGRQGHPSDRRSCRRGPGPTPGRRPLRPLPHQPRDRGRHRQHRRSQRAL